MHAASSPTAGGRACRGRGSMTATRSAMILAAGLGTRLLPLTAAVPKPLLEVAGKTLIAHQLERLAGIGIERVVINLHHLSAMLRRHLGNGQTFGLEIHYSEEPELLETAGGIYQALPLLGDEPFLLVNGDVFSDFDLANLEGLDKGILAHLLMVPKPDWQERGDFDLQEADTGAHRLRLDGPGTLTYAGVARYHPILFSNLEPGFRRLRPVLEATIAAGQVSAQVHHGLWEDIGTLERLAALRARLARQEAPK